MGGVRAVLIINLYGNHEKLLRTDLINNLYITLADFPLSSLDPGVRGRRAPIYKL